MLRKLSLIGCLILAQIFLATGVFADEENEKDWSIEIDNTFNSKYVWRGINLVDDWVWQPSSSASYKWFTVSVWGNVELTDENDYDSPYGSGEGELTEVDYTVEFSHSWEKLLFAFGVIHYSFPNTGFDPTTEIYSSVGMDLVVTPSFTVYQDVDQADGTYCTLAVGKTFENFWEPSDSIGLSADLSAAASFGSDKYNEFYFGRNEFAFTDALFSASLPLAIGKYFSITPMVNYTMLIDGGIRNEMENDDNFFYGASLALSL